MKIIPQAHFVGEGSEETIGFVPPLHDIAERVGIIVKPKKRPQPHFVGEGSEETIGFVPPLHSVGRGLGGGVNSKPEINTLFFFGGWCIDNRLDNLKDERLLCIKIFHYPREYYHFGGIFKLHHHKESTCRNTVTRECHII